MSDLDLIKLLLNTGEKEPHPDAAYLASLSKDLYKLSDQIRHFAWQFEEYGKVDGDYLEVENVAIQLDKISILYKERMKLNGSKKQDSEEDS